MSKEQQTQSQDPSFEAADQARGEQAPRALPADIYEQVMRVPPNAPQALAQLLNLHGQFKAQILEVASSQLGMSIVKKALDIQASGQNAGISREEQDSVRALWGEDPSFQSKPGAAPEAKASEKASSEAAEVEAAAPAPAAAANKKAEPAWIAHARKYNDAHLGLVEEFNNLTGNGVMLDEGTSNPEMIAKWQRMHGLAADGMIGPKTVAAARSARNNNAAVAKTDPSEKKGEKIDV